ncbi:endophilin-B2 isoform X5 [Oryzias latipes]|uniref:endophilin-B2 isoform X5 n=1 Tax=Oryzias latipes TaxID=8090 RepID=UPI0005CB8AE4|nr:endophilin-B2 isoform X5 [Oryzias latipes]
MDFNVKRLATEAGLFLTRAVQFTEEKLWQSEKTNLDQDFENLTVRADCTKHWTEKILRQTEILLQPNPIDHTGARIEEFLYEKLDMKAPSRVTNSELLGQHMEDAAKELGLESPYGSTLVKVGECERRLGAVEKDFIQTADISFLSPLRNFLEGDCRIISKERRLLENLRLDLDACKTRVKKAKAAEAKVVPDFQETRPRNYVLSASASALWTEEVEKAEQGLKTAQKEFDRQAEVTRLLLEGISCTHVNHLRCLHEFVEAQAAYYRQCHLHMQDLQEELRRLPGGFAQNSSQNAPPPSLPEPESVSSPVETLTIEEVQAPASGTRKAKVLYDYDAADCSELSLLADEIITVYTMPGMESDWLVGERGNQRGRVPVTYLELLRPFCHESLPHHEEGEEARAVPTG